MLDQFKQEGKIAKHLHLSHHWKSWVEGGAHKVCTTCRDPYRVAASWANRNKLYRESHGKLHWEIQWDAHRELLDYNPTVYKVEDFTGTKVGSAGDTLGLHKALDEEDMETYHKIVPKSFIEYATRK